MSSPDTVTGRTQQNDDLKGLAGPDVIDGGEGNDWIRGEAGADTLIGGHGSDVLRGGSGDDALEGGRQADSLYGDEGNDTLDGGEGADILEGGSGADTYLLGRGSGADLIQVPNSVDNLPDGPDRVLLKDGLSLRDVVIRGGTWGFSVRILGTDDSLFVPLPETLDPQAVLVQGADGEVFTYGQAQALQSKSRRELQATEVVTSAIGQSLTGTPGDEYLRAAHASATLSGSAGDDSLWGSFTSTFVFNRGNGHDTISVQPLPGEQDNRSVVAFGAGIAPSDLRLVVAAQSVRVLVAGSQDELTLAEGYSRVDPAWVPLPWRFKFADGTQWTEDQIRASLILDPLVLRHDRLLGSGSGDILNGGQGEDTLIGDSGNDVLFGGEGLDSLSGDDGDDQMDGGTQADQLSGGSGNDTLEGGQGADVLNGGDGRDVYIFNRGDGRDTIWADAQGTNRGDAEDVIRFGAGITLQDIVVSTVGRNWTPLRVSLRDSQDSIDLSAPLDGPADLGQWDPSDTHGYGGGAPKPWGISRLEFADGTSLDPAQLGPLLNIGTSNADTLHGLAGADALNGLAGDDALYGGADNDTLNGGLGQDSLSGGQGSDTYVVRSGGGYDWIKEATNDAVSNGPWISQDVNVLSLPDFTPDDVARVISRGVWDQTYMLIDFKSGDRVRLDNQRGFTISDWSTTSYRAGVDQVVFGNGQVWDRDDLIARAVSKEVSTPWGDYLSGLEGQANSLQGLAGNDVLSGRGLADTLDGGQGLDSMYGGMGDDTYHVDGTTNARTGLLEADFVYETSGLGSGVDAVITKLSDYTLPDNVENLTMSGKSGASLDLGGLMAGKAGLRHGIGNDLDNSISGGSGADFFEGKGGNDTLQGGGGNDTLSGGLGDDLLLSDLVTSNDTYTWLLGDGSDTIVDAGGTDVLQLQGALSTDQIWLRQQGGDLRIDVLGGAAGGGVTVQNWFADSKQGVLERIELASGRWVDATRVDQLVSAMASLVPPGGTAALPAAIPEAAKPIVNALWLTTP